MSTDFIQDDTPWFRRIKLHRIRVGLTQKQAAAALQVQHRQYWSWESGQHVPGPENQRRLADLLGVAPEDLFGGATQDFTGLPRNT